MRPVDGPTHLPVSSMTGMLPIETLVGVMSPFTFAASIA
jgi:hypothetical protein